LLRESYIWPGRVPDPGLQLQRSPGLLRESYPLPELHAWAG